MKPIEKVLLFVLILSLLTSTMSIYTNLKRIQALEKQVENHETMLKESRD
jgi:Na+-transporting NADH:ubiquinone oxidoreductase subunit NqrC